MTVSLSTTPRSMAEQPPQAVCSRRVKVVKWAERQVKKLDALPRLLRDPVRRAARLLFDGASIGLLRPKDVDELVEVGYQEQWIVYDPRHYALPHDEQMLPVLQKLATGTNLLDAFCGQGREAELLAKAGFIVTGVDRLPEMIDGARKYANEQDFDATFVTADFANYDDSSTFDVVYPSCWMYSTIQGARRRQAFLQKCHKLCAPSGLVVISFDIRVGSFVVGFAKHLIARITGFVTRGNLRSEPGERITSGGLFWQCHTEESVCREVCAAGFDVVETVKGTENDVAFLFLSPVDGAASKQQSGDAA